MRTLLTTRQFAERVGVVPETIRRWVRAGHLRPAGRTPTGQHRFAPEQVEATLHGPVLTDGAQEIAAHVQAAQARLRRLPRVL